jgi:hypothetical protein
MVGFMIMFALCFMMGKDMGSQVQPYILGMPLPRSFTLHKIAISIQGKSLEIPHLHIM